MKKSLDTWLEYPEDMTTYLRNYGFHFSKKAFEFAVKKMKRMNPSTGRPEKIQSWSKEQVDALLERHGVKLENDTLYDAAFVANMCKSDYLGSSIPDEMHLARFVKDYLDDYDAGDEVAFRRWFATMVGNGEPIDWSGIL